MPKRSLGKGIDALILSSGGAPAGITSNGHQKVLDLSIDMVKPNPEQPRKDFDEQALEELAQSIKEKGVIQPVLVQEAGFGEYILIAGERRYRASLKAGMKTIPAIIRKYDEEETLEIALIENLQRENLNALEEALAFQKLMEHFQLTQDDIAARLGKSRSAIANSIRLLRLPAEVQDQVRRNQLSAGHARAILSLSTDGATQIRFAAELETRGLSVREAETLAKQINGGSSIDLALSALLEDKQNQQQAVPVGAGTSPELESFRDITRGATLRETDPAESARGQDTKPVEFNDIEERLIERLGTKVQLKGDLKSGKIEIMFYSSDDLGRIFELLTKGR